jgi:hypothetical protein
MDFASVLLICFGVLLVAGIFEGIAARWGLYRKQSLVGQGGYREARLKSALPILGPTMADGGGADEK